MDKTEFEARVHEIKEKAWQLGTNQYADGFEKGYAEGTRNQDEVQYKHGYDDGLKEAEKRLKDPDVYAEGYNKGLEDMWDVWNWYVNAKWREVFDVFPEYRENGECLVPFVNIIHDIGLVECIHRVKTEEVNSDSNLLYSTISNLKSDYTKDQIIKALKDNEIEVIEVKHE